MKKIHVQSSNLKAIGYDRETHTLEVDFLNHSTYQYYSVPETVYTELMRADSHGHALHILVKQRHYNYRRIS